MAAKVVDRSVPEALPGGACTAPTRGISIIFNPAAGRRRRRTLDRVVRALEARELDVCVAATSGPGDATRLTAHRHERPHRPQTSTMGDHRTDRLTPSATAYCTAAEEESGMTNKNFNWDDPADAQRAMDALDRQIKLDSNTPGSGVRMCHAQGKTAVYLSPDRRHIVHHAPDGSIERKPYSGSAR